MEAPTDQGVAQEALHSCHSRELTQAAHCIHPDQEGVRVEDRKGQGRRRSRLGVYSERVAYPYFQAYLGGPDDTAPRDNLENLSTRAQAAALAEVQSWTNIVDKRLVFFFANMQCLPAETENGH